jgi:hypothetical protein
LKRILALLVAVCVHGCDAPKKSPAPAPMPTPRVVERKPDVDSTLPPGLCRVRLCNRLKRFSLDPISHIKDSLGEVCIETMIPKADARPGKRLASDSRWWQGSFNPSKRSVTKVDKVLACSPTTNTESKQQP